MDSLGHSIADLEGSPFGLSAVSTPIDAFFKPHSVAVIGATERLGSAGHTVLVNLMASDFGGAVHPVNPKHETVLGLTSFATVEAVPGRVDLAVIAIPAGAVPDVISQCVAKDVRGAIVLSSGFKESGANGAALERELLERAREGALRLLGPNCLGVICPSTGLNASFASVVASPGTVGFASQSGALCSSILDWSLSQQIGFSAFISMGSMVDIGWGEVIYYLGDDPRTKSIVLYIESIGDVRTFLSAAREVALSKPIILIKSGHTSVAAETAVRGTDDVFDAAFERSGLLRVDTIEELFSMTGVLAKQPRPLGKRLTIVTNAGGLAELASNALIQGGGEMASLGKPTRAALDAILPPSWSHDNPIDVLGDATPERFAKTIEIVAADPDNDGLLVTYARLGAPTALEVAERIAKLGKLSRKPILASWMGGDEVAAAAKILERAGIPTLAYPDAAAHVFNLMWRYDDNLRALLETPTLASDEATPNRAVARALIAGVLAQGRTQLSEAEAKRLLAAYEISTGPGVQRSIEVEDGYELIVGSSVDPQFGPVLRFGHGGQLVEVLQDRALGLPPLTETLARRLIGKTRISKALAGARGLPPIDLDALSQCLVRFSNLIVDQPRIKEFEINPLLATAERILALDTRVMLHSSEIVDDALPRTAIRPYPSQYEGTWIARDGARLTIRPVRPEDELLMRRFHTELSEKSTYLRYALAVRLADLVSHEKLARLCFIDYAHEIALIALRTTAEGKQELVGIGQLVMEHERNEAEFALLVSDSFHGNGLGTELLRRLVEIGRKERVGRIVGHILADNRPMLDVARRLGFHLRRELGGPMIASIIDLCSSMDCGTEQNVES
jgi:acetyltransferase